MADDYRLGGAVMFVDFYQLYLLMNGNRFYKQLIVYAINILLQFLLSRDKQLKLLFNAISADIPQ